MRILPLACIAAVLTALSYMARMVILITQLLSPWSNTLGPVRRFTGRASRILPVNCARDSRPGWQPRIHRGLECPRASVGRHRPQRSVSVNDDLERRRTVSLFCVWTGQFLHFPGGPRTGHALRARTFRKACISRCALPQMAFRSWRLAASATRRSRSGLSRRVMAIWWVPPAPRWLMPTGPTSQPTAPSAPFDPAFITTSVGARYTPVSRSKNSTILN